MKGRVRADPRRWRGPATVIAKEGASPLLYQLARTDPFGCEGKSASCVHRGMCGNGVHRERRCYDRRSAILW